MYGFHVFISGTYLSVDLSGEIVSNKAWWVSETLSSDSDKRCLRFAYFMSGENVGTLNVFEQSVNSGKM